MKYTELFAEYIRNGGEYPAIFDKLPNIYQITSEDIITFKDLFYNTFAACEIGSETEELFALRFNAKANLIVPFYIKKYEDLQKISYETPKTRTFKHDAYGEGGDAAYTTPSTGVSDPILPPAAGNVSGQNYRKYEDHTTDVTSDKMSEREAWELHKDIEEHMTNFWQDLLNEFCPLFMGVF